MKSSLPLIRAASIYPVRRWLTENGRDPLPFLEASGLDWVPPDAPFLPIPVRGAVSLLGEIVRAEGPDAPVRIVGDRGAFEIGLIGDAALSGASIREGLALISRNMRLHCTHEHFRVDEADGELRISDGWSMSLGRDDDLHSVQQYVAALIDMVCSIATGRSGNFSSVEMMPHSEAGLSHLRSWLGDRVIPARQRALIMVIESSVADLRFPEWARSKTADKLTANMPSLRKDRALADDLAILLEGMLPRRRPTVDYVAKAAGISARTLKRRLRDEGVSFSDVLESTRARLALRRLGEENPPPLAILSEELGFANQETLTRAMSRWSGKGLI